MEKKILIVGLCCLDTVNYVEKYPEEDSDTRVFEQRTCLGGNSANSATVLRQFTEKVELCASLPGNDETLTRKLAEVKVDYSSSFIRRDPSISVPHSTVICNTKNGSRTVLHYRGNLPEISASEFKVDVIFMSKDFAKVKGWRDGNSAILGLEEKYGAKGKIIICPWGATGVFAIDPSTDNTPFFVEAIPVKAVDTLGAGDCFLAASIWGMYSGKSLSESMKFAVEVAAKKCSQIGLLNISIQN